MGLELIAIAATAASGLVSYVGAQRSAQAAEYSAEAEQARADVNAKIAYQRRQAESQDSEFQAGVQDYNKQVTIAEFGRQELQFEDKVQELNATFANNAFSTQGSFSDLFNAKQSEFNLAANKLYSDTAQKSFNYDAQADLFTNQANRSLTLGSYEAKNVLSEGANRANAFKNQASAARTQGIGSLLGAAGQSAQLGVKYYG